MKNNIFELTPDNDFHYWMDPVAEGFKLYHADRWRSDLDYRVAILEDLPELRAALGEDQAEALGVQAHSPDALIDFIRARDPGLIDDIMEYYELEEIAELRDYEEGVMYQADDETLDGYIEHLGYNVGTVGYSQWAYYIALPDVPESYIRDCWEGWNWYAITQYNRDGDVVDTLGGVYAPTDEDIADAIADHFSFDGPALLVDNEDVRYSKLPKVKKIAHVSYTFSREEAGPCL